MALLCAAAQLAVAAHLTLVRHQACPEHGDLLHGDRGHHAGASRRRDGDAVHGVHAAPQAQSETAAYRAAGVAGAQDQHDHCSVPCERRKQVLSTASCVLVSAALGAVTWVPQWTRAQLGVEPLSLAPKQSPPGV